VLLFFGRASIWNDCVHLNVANRVADVAVRGLGRLNWARKRALP
jgi:hypothetical protein